MSARDQATRLVRSILGVFVGLMLVSFIAEGIEFALVTIANGSTTTDQDLYFQIRNGPLFLAAKFLYNGLAGLAGGYAAAWIAGRAPLVHGAVLALVQLAGLIYGMTASPYADSTPVWAWVGFVVVTTPACVAGAWLRGRRRASMEGAVRNR